MTTLVVGPRAALMAVQNAADDGLESARCAVVETLADAHLAAGSPFDDLVVLDGTPADAETHLRGLLP